MPLTPREIHLDTPEFDQAFELRRQVLLDPFSIDHERARADDAIGLHVGLFDAGRCLATLFLVAQDDLIVKMRQVAVAAHLQGQGLGRTLVEYAEQVARDHGFTKVFAHARAHAIPFYLALGYSTVGEAFVEVGIVHHVVEKTL